MKTNKLTRIIGLIGFFLFLSCNNNFEEDFLEEAAQQEEIVLKQLSAKRIVTEEIRNNPVLNTLMEKSKVFAQGRESSQSKEVYSPENDFSVNTDEAMYTSYGDYHSYTFEVFREEPNGLLENLLISLQKDGSYKSWLIAYTLDDSDFESIANNEYIEGIEKRVAIAEIDIDSGSIISSLAANETDPCKKEVSRATGWTIQLYASDCEDGDATGDGDNGDSTHNNDPNGAQGDPNYPGNNDGYNNTGDNDGNTSGGGGSNSDGDLSCFDCNGTDFSTLITSSDIHKLNIDLGFTYASSNAFWLRSFENKATAAQLIYFLEFNTSSEALSFAKEAVTMLRTGNRTQKAFVNSLLEADISTAAKLLVEDEPINCCQFDPSCCNNEVFDPVVQLTARIVIDASDAVFNYFMFMLEAETSWSRRGRAVRGFMEDLGVDVPNDIDNRTLGRLFKVRKRNLDIVIEPVGDYKDTLLDVGISMLDILAVISPSKGASAYLFVKGSGLITAKAISNYLKLISVNAAKIDGLITRLVPKAKYSLDGTGAFRYLKGHHPLAKIAFNKNKARNYSELDAFSVSKSKLESFGGPDVHNIITGKQTSLYKEFGRTGERLTIEKMADIEIKAMVQAGIPEDIATGWVIKALQDLKLQNVKTIPHIPWVGKN
tara:strand:+ start:155 stop:2125 length:1971 start_codon:yes stop_codon:yes gene_type:complete